MKKRFSASRPTSPIFQASVVATMVAFGIYFDHVAAMRPPPEKVAALHADLARESAAPEVQQVAQWAVASRDHAGLPFVVIDRARLFAFDPKGQLLGSSVLHRVAPHTEAAAAPMPAGRFVADTWRSARSDAVVWVNAGTAFSVNGAMADAAPAPALPAAGGRGQPAPSGGALQVAGDFYREHLSGLKSQLSVAYVLPQGQAWHDLLAAYPPVDWPQLTFAQRRAQEPRSPS